MAQFIYIYKSADGTRHEAEIDSPSRDEAFASLRRQGIRPVKVIARDGSRANGAIQGIRKRVVFLLVVLAALLGGLLAFLGSRPNVEFYRADGSIGAAREGEIAKAMVRRQVFGDVERIEGLFSGGASFIFRDAAELFLSQYVEPGREVAAMAARPGDEAFKNCLNRPIYTFRDEMPECVEMKCLVAGIKEELRMFLAGGGTVTEYLDRLVRRQKMECDYRKKAVGDLMAIFEKGNDKTSYQSWKEMNAWLNSMGIKPIPLPETLIAYERTLDASVEDKTIESIPVILPGHGRR